MKRPRNTYLSAIAVLVAAGLAGHSAQAQSGFGPAPAIAFESADRAFTAPGSGPYTGQAAVYQPTVSDDVPVVQVKSFKKKLKLHYKYRSYKKPKVVKKVKRHPGYYAPHHGLHPKKYKAHRGHHYRFKPKFRGRY